MESLNAFRAAVQDGRGDYTLVDPAGNPTEDILAAQAVRVGTPSQEYDLASPTAFVSKTIDPPQLDLRTVIYCWRCKDLSVAEYFSECDAKSIPNLKFLERTDLIDWLEGSSSTSDYIETSAAALDASLMDVDAGEEQEPIVGRGTLSDHNTALHGVRPVDFHSAVALSQSIFGKGAISGVPAPGAADAGEGGSGAGSSLPALKPSKGKDPIILLSPSPSSLLNMANVQAFLEKGEFVATLKSSSTPNLLRITRKSNTIGPKVRFVVVDSTENFKPEYWDRVVAVFVTGQPWQLRQYKWHDAKSLFQHVLGFGLEFKNDPIPETLKQWNVKVETLERNTRFRDREVVERIWERIEMYMVSRGWPTGT